jgi:hypothetical protein
VVPLLQARSVHDDQTELQESYVKEQRRDDMERDAEM